MQASFGPVRPHSSLRAVGPLACLLVVLAFFAGCASAPTLGQRQAGTLTRLGFKKVDDGWLLILPERISFEFGKDDLKPEFRKTIDDFARELLAVDIRQLRVEGHTDNIGTHDYNLALSERRANIVADVFVADGFAPADVQRKGFAFDRPAADNGTPEGRAQNRRVEIIVLSTALAMP